MSAGEQCRGRGQGQKGGGWPGQGSVGHGGVLESGSGRSGEEMISFSSVSALPFTCRRRSPLVLICHVSFWHPLTLSK